MQQIVISERRECIEGVKARVATTAAGPLYCCRVEVTLDSILVEARRASIAEAERAAFGETARAIREHLERAREPECSCAGAVLQ